MVIRACLALFALLPLVAQANSQSAWEQVQAAESRRGVDVYVKPVEGSAIKAFKGVTEVPWSMLRIMALVSDLDSYPSWIYQCSDVKVRRGKWDDGIIRMMIDGIWPVSDRDAIIQSRIWQNPETGAIIIHSTNVEGLVPKREGYVRIPDLDNKFVITPLEDGWTRIMFRTYVDPGGFIPAWLANMVATEAPEYTLTRMAELLKKDRYAIDSRAQLSLAIPGLSTVEFPVLQQSSAPVRADAATDSPAAGATKVSSGLGRDVIRAN